MFIDLRNRPTQQEDVEDVILEALENGAVRTTGEITAAVRGRIILTPADRLRAVKRPNESKIDQIIANALQTKRRLCRDGLIERTGHGEFRITEGGRAYLAKFRAEVESMSETLAGILGSRSLD
ncbi:winged helix-turn-helix domain-containing protein [Sphingosinicella sp.]|uniref:winged helix-turn-helix domain-containing protein n=1 Tax=Sphingosinicella sp. TaxID=1917971 RepID=UPI004038160E